MLADAAARRRFRKEALSLARVNFPNIATIHEFGSEEDLDFLVTEFIPGTTLDAKLKSGRLSQQEILQLGVQLAQGLAAAHQHGIVHRDLKPGNLRITPDGRLKILDFGLAQFAAQVSDLGQTVTLTKSTELTGTLPYMAPEQLKGEAAHPRSDIWAAGVVLYEMTTGQRPFPQTNSAMLINAILNETAPAPTSLIPDTSPNLENIILKAMEKNPARRYQSAVEMCVDLERILYPSRSSAPGEAPPSKPVEVRTGRPAWYRWGIAVGALALVLIAVYLARQHFRGTASSQSEGIPLPARKSVAVWGFKNLSGKPDQNWLSNALSEMLTAELSAGDKVKTIAGENVARTKAEMKLPENESMSAQTLANIYQRLGSDLVVLGSYIDVGGQTRVDVRIQDTAKGETVATISASEPDAKLLDLVKDLGAQLREKCGAGALTGEEAAAVRASQPETVDAARLYSEGLARLRAFDNLGARELLEKAVAAEPHNALAHLALARAWGELGYDAKAESEAKQAYELSRNFPRKENLLIEANYREAMRTWDRAVELYKSLWTFYPDDLEYGLRLADAQVPAGQVQSALSTVKSLRQLPAPLRNDARIDLVEAKAQAFRADFRQAQTAAQSAEKKAAQLGERFLTAQALLEQCQNLRELGQYADAKAKGEQAETTFREAGDFRSQAKSLTCVATVSAAQGDTANARGMYEKALVLAQQVGAQSDIAGSLINLGNLLGASGQIEESNKQYRDALSVAQAAGDNADALLAETNLAANLMSQGNLDAARQQLESSLQRAQALDDPSRALEARINLGMIGAMTGQLEEARTNLGIALQQSRSLGQKSYEATCQAVLGDIALAQGDLATAGKLYQQALEIRTQLGEKGSIASTQLAQAGLALEQNRTTEAEALASKAVQEFELEKLPDQEASARDTLAQAWLAAKRVDDAAAEMAKARGLTAGDPPTQLSLAITEARVLAAQGNASGAVEKLQAAVQRAQQLLLVGYDLQARLALHRIQLAQGDGNRARAALQALARDAKQLHYNLIAQKAEALLSPKAGQ